MVEIQFYALLVVLPVHSCISSIHITKCHLGVLYVKEDDSDSVVHAADVTTSPKRRAEPAVEPTISEPVIDYSNTFPVHVNIERAFHLPMVLENR